MAELAQMVHRGASLVTPDVLKKVVKNIAAWKLDFAQLNTAPFPHLQDQLQFLANFVEDFHDGEADDVPYLTAASAVYALIYAHRKYDLIPDHVPAVGLADDSGVVRVVLIEHERHLAGDIKKGSANELNPLSLLCRCFLPVLDFTSLRIEARCRPFHCRR